MKCYSQFHLETFAILLYLYILVDRQTHLINESSNLSWIAIELMTFKNVFFNQKWKIKIVEYVAFTQTIVFNYTEYIFWTEKLKLNTYNQE